MKKILFTTIALFSILMVGSVRIAKADNSVQFVPQSTEVNKIGGCDGTAKNSSICNDIDSSGNPLFGPDGILTKVARIFGILTGVISVFMIIISGLRYVTSSGDAAKTATARQGIMYAAIGIIVAAVAGAIVQFVLSKV